MSREVTALLAECGTDDGQAFDQLIVLVYDDLRRIAHRRLRAERQEHTLDTTAVVHEAYLRLTDGPDTSWRDRAHFFAVCARVIRHVLVDHARRRAARKRGGGAVRVALHENIADTPERLTDILSLEEALESLESLDARLVRVVECRFFAGMTVEETVEALGSSRRTVERDWTRARTYLYQALSGGPTGEST